MAKYKVTLVESQTTEFEIEGENEDDARSLAYQAWENGELGYASLEVEIDLEEV